MPDDKAPGKKALGDKGRDELPPAGWYEDPEDSVVKRYWDGERWTQRTRRPATPKRRTVTKWCAVGVLALLVVGGFLAVNSPAWTGRTASGELVCDLVQRGAEVDTGAPTGLWLVWLVMVVLVGRIVTYAWEDYWKDSLLRTAAVLGIIAAVFTFPGFLSMSFVASCGL